MNRNSRWERNTNRALQEIDEERIRAGGDVPAEDDGEEEVEKESEVRLCYGCGLDWWNGECVCE